MLIEIYDIYTPMLTTDEHTEIQSDHEEYQHSLLNYKPTQIKY